MYRRRRRRSKADTGTSLLIIIASVVFFILVKLIILLWPYLLAGVCVYLYLRWQKQRLNYHKGSWQAFYQSDLRPIIRSLTYILPIISVIVISIIYLNNKSREKQIKEAEKLSIEIAKAQQEKTERERIAFEVKRDSSNYILSLAANKSFAKGYKEAMILIDSALAIMPTNSVALHQKIILSLKAGKCREAYLAIDKSDIPRYQKDSLFMLTGHCFIRSNDQRSAVQIFYTLSKSNYPEAEALHNKLNPIVKVFSHSVTQCCDGSTSYSTGRGTCSHHKGVCGKRNIYKERRKYSVFNN